MVSYPFVHELVVTGTAINQLPWCLNKESAILIPICLITDIPDATILLVRLQVYLLQQATSSCSEHPIPFPATCLSKTIARRHSMKAIESVSKAVTENVKPDPHTLLDENDTHAVEMFFWS